MFSTDTDDNLFSAASEETTATEEQTGGEAGAESLDGMKARIAALEAELGKKSKQIENANKLIGRKAVDMDTLRALGLTKEEQTQATQQAVETMGRADGQQMAQQIGGDELEAWFNNAAKQFGTAKAIRAMFNAYLPEALGQYLGPVNEQLTVARDRVNQAAIKGAITRLGEEFEDVDAKAEAIKSYWKDNPKKYQQLMDTSTDEDEKYDLLETAYLKVSKIKSVNSVAASKAAGAVEAKQREQAKASSVTSGSGARSSKDGGEKNPADLWFEQMVELDKGRKLFD